MKTVFARISTAIVAVAAVAASVLVVAPAASAAVSTSNITMFQYRTEWQPGGTTAVALDATRLDFNTSFQHLNMASLVGHTISVNSLNTGLDTNQSLYDYAYVRFFNDIDLDMANHVISFSDPCSTQNPRPTVTGVQINASTTTQCPGVVVPAGTVAMTIGYTSAFNGQIGSYSNVLSSGSNVSSTPRVYDNGSPLTYTGVASNASAPAGLYYIENYSYSTVKGHSTTLTVPASGVTSVDTKIVACVDFSGFRAANGDVFTSTLKINGVATDSQTTHYQWGIPGMFSQWGQTLSTAGGGSAATWENNNVRTLQAGGSYTDYSPVGGTVITPALEVSNGTSSVVTSCAPAAPTATGTLSATGSSIQFTPDASFQGKNWTVQVYRNDNNVVVGSGFGSGTNNAMVNGLRSQNGPPMAIPYGVPLYAKVSVNTDIGDGSGTSVSFASAYSSAKSALFTLTPPTVTFPTQPSGLTTEGKAGITADTLDYSGQVASQSFLMDAGMSTPRQPVSDGKNGFWYWNDQLDLTNPQSPAGSLKLYHYNQNGPDTAFAGGNGALLETSPYYSYIRMGWVGNRDTWVASVTKDETVYGNGNTPWADRHYGLDVITGNMSGTFTKKSYSYTAMDTFCNSVYPGSLFKNNSVSVVNTPDTNPWLYIVCTDPADSNSVYASRGVYAKSTSAGLASVFKFNSSDPTVENMMSIVGSTVYPNASAATDTAVAVLFATGKASTSSQQYSYPSTAALVARKLVRIAKNGTTSVLEGEAAWHEATPSANFGAVTSNASLVALPQLSANGALVGLTRNGSSYAILNAGTSGGFGTATSADNITYDEVSAPTQYAMQSTLAWARGGANIVGTATAPLLTRTSSSVTTNLAQAKFDWGTRKVSTQEIVSYVAPMSTQATSFVDMNGRLVLAYTNALNKLGFVRWAGAASLPAGVNVTSQNVNYVLNAGGDVVLTGSGLGATSGATKVLTAKVNGVAATIKARTATTLTITAPANATATAETPVTGNIELGFADDQGGVVGQLTYVGATKLTPVVTQTLSSASAYFGDADRDFSASATMSPVTVTPVTTTSAACSIVNGKVHFVAAGTCTVTSTVAATAYNNAASEVATITVNKPTATITLNVGDLTAYASDADRDVTVSAALDTDGTAPTPVLSATPATVCAIVSGKVDFRGAGNCVVKATIANSTAINGDTEQATIVVTKVTPTVTVSVAGETDALIGDADRNVTVTASAGTAVVTSTTPLVCTVIPASGDTPNKVHFVGTGNCVVKAQVASSATLNASNAALSTAIAVRKANAITVGWATGFAPNASGDEADAPVPVITVASGTALGAPTVTSTTTAVCTITADGNIWIHLRDTTCTLHIVSPATNAVWAQQTYDWNITTLPAVGDSADSALKVRNDSVIVGLSAIAVKWNQATNQVYFVTKSKRVGPVVAKMTFTPLATVANPDPDPVSCTISYTAKKPTADKVGQVHVVTSPLAFCQDTTLKGVPKTNQTAAYNAFKELVAYNSGLGQGTVVTFNYKFEKHRDDNNVLVDVPLANKEWSADAFANLYYLATDTVTTTALPAGATTAPVTATADGAFVPSIAFESKRLDYTLTSADDTKCEVTSDGRIWAKVAGETCSITVATTTNTTKWEQKSKNWTFTMSPATVAADDASAVIAPSNNTAVNVGPLTIKWNQATSAVLATFTSRNPGKVSATMTFTGTDNASYSCTVNFGSTAAVPVATRGSFVTQANTVTFCNDTKLTGAAKTAQATALTKFKALVTARKSGAGQGVIPATFTYKFEQHDRGTGAIIGSPLTDLLPSAGLVVKLNYRATAN